jgi:predicted MFS family arabinose efflux permease
MNDRNLLRGLFLIALSLTFGLTAVLKYPIGDFAHGGPGLFPTLVSFLLLLIGVATVIRSQFVDKVKMNVSFRNIGIILGSLSAFAVITLFVNMIAAIIVMVFIATLAGTTYSWWRNVKISAGLVAMAFVFAKLLGMNLPLY